MPIDWKALVQVAINRLWPIILTAGATYLSTKWEAGAQALKDLNSGHTVSMWGGVINVSLANLQYWSFTGFVALVSIVTGWITRVKLKRQANIALALPKGATIANVNEVSQATNLLSSTPDSSTLTQVSRSIPKQ